MNTPFRRFSRNLALFLLFAFLPVRLCATGNYLNQIGVTLLRAATTNIDGRGINIAQPEASDSSDTNLDVFEVSPLYLGYPTNAILFIAQTGSTSAFPNSIGQESIHANNVGNLFYSHNNGVATNVAHIDSFDANWYIYYYLNDPPPAPIDSIVNQSFTFGNVVYTNPDPYEITVDQQVAIDIAYDNYANITGTLFISAVNDQASVSPPGTAYNSIGVASYGVGTTTAVGPTLDHGRCKPDITAPGPSTSESTPLVAGAATLLLQAGLRGDGGPDTNSAADMRVLKALLLNGAVKPLGWTNGPATPLDARYGAGAVNVFNAYEQLAGRKLSSPPATLVPTTAPHPPIAPTNFIATLLGWDFNTNSSTATNDCVTHYWFSLTNSPGHKTWLADATLVWNRQNYPPGWTNGLGIGINNLALYLYGANSNLVNCSTSLVDNVQQIHLTALAPGNYDLQVWHAGGTNQISTNETYALTYSFTPVPALAIAPASAQVTLTWPAYPDGFVVQSATNLLHATWSTNGLPYPTYTNSLKAMQIPATNHPVYFRLVSPNF